MGTVYIVDDDANFARGIARLVQAAGWSARTFASAAEFLEHSHDGSGDACVLLDVRMPGLRGPEAHAAMLAAGSDLPVIYLTGHGDIPTSVDAMRRGALDFLEKPVRSETLLASIRNAFARHAQARARGAEQRELRERVARLSGRERQVMEHVIAGRLNKQIAADLGISEKTVKVHRGKVMEKMQAGSVAALVDLCRAAGIGPATGAPEEAQGLPR